MLAYTIVCCAGSVNPRTICKYKENPDEVTKGQLYNLKRRIVIIKNMQIFGALSFFFCVTCMFLIFFQSHVFGGYCFWNQFVAFVDFVGIAGV